MNQSYKCLRDRFARIAHLRHARNLLQWDMLVNMSTGSAGAQASRSDQSRASHAFKTLALSSTILAAQPALGGLGPYSIIAKNKCGVDIQVQVAYHNGRQWRTSGVFLLDASNDSDAVLVRRRADGNQILFRARTRGSPRWQHWQGSEVEPVGDLIVPDDSLHVPLEPGWFRYTDRWFSFDIDFYSTGDGDAVLRQ